MLFDTKNRNLPSNKTSFILSCLFTSTTVLFLFFIYFFFNAICFSKPVNNQTLHKIQTKLISNISWGNVASATEPKVLTEVQKTKLMETALEFFTQYDKNDGEFSDCNVRR